ncbi:MAG: D-alanine--D-alanine ligase [Pseudomonadota bacterium]
MSLAQLSNLPVSVLLGGKSSEREVSLDSGAAVARALTALGARVTEVDTASEGWWHQLEGAALAFIALHGPGGEDGEVQGLLQAMAIPFTGSGVLASALAMDKVLCKQLWTQMGLSTPPYATLHQDTDWAAVIDELGAAFVKPVTGGSSVGTHLVTTVAELAAAWRDASQYGAVMAERLIAGPEYTVAILNDATLPVIRVESSSGFYDYQAKYHSDSTRYLCPCGLSASDEAAVAQLALDAFQSIGCKGWGRVDVMSDDGDFYLLEVNTVPGMTSHSLVPMAAAARDMDFATLVGEIACLGLNAEGQHS